MKFTRSIRLSFLVSVIFLAACGNVRDSGTTPSDPVPAGPAGAEARRVERVVDGDTLILDRGERVRLIGVDTPETKHPEMPVQRFGEEASAFTRGRLEGKDVYLEYGPERRDAYDRLLAYVWVDGILFNREIIRRGYAVATTRFEHSRLEDFLVAESEARQRRYGLWHDSPTDGRVAHLIRRWDGLDPEGKRLLDLEWDRLLEAHPAPVAAPAPAAESAP